MVGAALCTGGLGLKLAQYVQCIVLCLNHASFNSNYVWKLTMETVVDSSNVAFEYMDAGGCGSAVSLLCCENGMVKKHFPD